MFLFSIDFFENRLRSFCGILLTNKDKKLSWCWQTARRV